MGGGANGCVCGGVMSEVGMGRGSGDGDGGGSGYLLR